MAHTKDGYIKVELDRLPDGPLELEESDLRDQPGVIRHRDGVVLLQANGKFVIARIGDSWMKWVPGRAFDTSGEAQRWLDRLAPLDRPEDYIWVRCKKNSLTVITYERVGELLYDGAEPLCPVETLLAADHDWCTVWMESFHGTYPVTLDEDGPLPELG